MISLALKATGAGIVGGVWIAERVEPVPDGARLALLGLGVIVGYAAVRAENGRRGGFR